MKKLLFAHWPYRVFSCLPRAKKKVRVHTIGDSTMADYAENTTRTRGWGGKCSKSSSPTMWKS